MSAREKPTTYAATPESAAPNPYLDALRAIAFLRPGGLCRSKLVEQMERIAVDAIYAEPWDFALVPADPGACELDDSGFLLIFMRELHANVPEGERPSGWASFSDAQRERIKAAYRAMLAAVAREHSSPRQVVQPIREAK